MDSYVASNGSCFFVGTWNICKNHLFEVGLTPNSDNKALWKLTTVDSFYFIMCEDPAWMQLQWNSIELVEGLVTCDFYTTPEGPTWFWKCLGTAYGDYVWAFTISWSWLLARVWSGPKTPTKTQQRTDMSYKPMDWNKFAWLYEPVLEKRTNNRWLNTIEKPKTENAHYWCTRLVVEWFLRGPTMANSKSVGLQNVQQ